ncbi:MAG: histidinol-phosphate transaminase [Nitrospinota bacterium]|nr:MAG: histidinol-phosphate transaminase [Nitrospinota bacterium]
MDWKTLIRPEIVQLKAYTVDRKGVRIRLNANESPYPLPESVRRRVLAALETTEFHRYPDPEAKALREVIGEWIGVAENALLLGNGSDELIQIIATTFGEEGGVVLFPEPTFEVYRIAALTLGERPYGIPLTDDWDLPFPEILEAIRRLHPRVIFLSYPNNPTGNCFTREKIEQILQESSGIVVLDEAYFPFSQKTFLPSLGQYDHLLILRTLSKIGMAGLRVGILIGHPALVAEINKVRAPYNVNALSQVAARVILEEWPLIEPQIAQIVAERDRLYRKLQTIPHLTVYPSEANFFLLQCARGGAALWEHLMAEGILVRRYPDHPMLKEMLRVTVGQPEENEVLCQAIHRFCSQE